MVRICFVCLGNICRSPTAEGVMRGLLDDAGCADRVEIDSAGTSAHHVGDSPDRRSTKHARRRGVILEGASRQFVASDFARFDYVVAMDRSNLQRLQAMAPNDVARARVVLLRDFDPESPEGAEVPDPYYGGDAGFEEVLDICEAGCRGLLETLRARNEL